MSEENLLDLVGNNAALRCPSDGCGKVFIVSAHLHRDGRSCPDCGNSVARIWKDVDSTWRASVVMSS